MTQTSSSTVSLDLPARLLPAIGPRRAKLLARVLGEDQELTLGQLLSLYPRVYEDRRNVSLIRDLRPGEIATFYGTLHRPLTDRRTPSGKVLIEGIVSDGSGMATLCWFNQPYLKKKLRCGERFIITGKVERFLNETRITQPDMEKMEDRSALSGGRIVPIYPLTEGLQQPVVRTALREALDRGVDLLPEILPAWLIQSRSLMKTRDAVENTHFPTTPNALEAARRRLKFEELFLLQMFLALRKTRDQARPAVKLTIDEPVAAEIRRMVPFEPTGAQKKVVREIFRDLVRPTPMNRLLQGDVGSGKTIVAAIAMVAVVRNGCQVAVMVPTEILAEQHAATLAGLLEPLGIPVRLLTGSVTGREREAVLSGLASGALPVVVGTHALIQEGVRFQRLALAVVDEQHRFGVEQRMRIQQQGASAEDPHVLVMTATPIPRTLSLTAYGHLDLSIIDEMPPGRTPVKTRWVSRAQREKVYNLVRKQVEKGRQAYVVCPLVEESARVEATPASVWFEHLQRHIFPELRVGLVHGRMRGAEKELAMSQFRRGETDILTATTVIEVGVDVPNASVMVIEDANCFGLAQLHQLRGRVGRGEHDAACFLVTEERFNPSRMSGKTLFLEEEPPGEELVGQRRMRILVESSDGFRIAEEDFRLRGVGIYFGTRQHGRSRLRIADLHRDMDVLQEARAAAFELVQADAGLEKPEHALLRDRVAGISVDYEIDEDYTSVA